MTEIAPQAISRRRALRLVAAAGSVVSGKVWAQSASGQGLLAKLQSDKKARVGVANQIPYSALNPDGSLTGAAPDVTKVIMGRLGVPELEGFIATYGQLIPGMMAGRWDFVAASLTITKARCAQVLFCDPLVYDGDVIVALKDTQPAPTARISDLAKIGAVVGCQAGGADYRAIIAAGVSPDNIRQFTNDPAIMDGVLARRVQYAVMSNSPARALIAQRNLDVQTAYPVEDVEALGSGCAFRKDDTDLYGAYEKELHAMRVSGELKSILQKYGFELPPEKMTAEFVCR